MQQVVRALRDILNERSQAVMKKADKMQYTRMGKRSLDKRELDKRELDKRLLDKRLLDKREVDKRELDKRELYKREGLEKMQYTRMGKRSGARTRGSSPFLLVKASWKTQKVRVAAATFTF